MTPWAADDRGIIQRMTLGITDLHNAGEVSENNQTAVAAPEDVVSVVRLLVQKQLRGIGRFGYRVSKENFLFLGLDSPSISNPAARRVFRSAAGIAEPVLPN
jgi:hypothetical protein